MGSLAAQTDVSGPVALPQLAAGERLLSMAGPDDRAGRTGLGWIMQLQKNTPEDEAGKRSRPSSYTPFRTPGSVAPAM